MSLIIPPTREELDAKKQALQQKIEEKETNKQILAVEKEYREGLTSLTDVIAPAALTFEN